MVVMVVAVMAMVVVIMIEKNGGCSMRNLHHTVIQCNTQ
jgi:hypothetical protein